MIIDWRVIPHKEQRYPTCGDWWWVEDVVGQTLQLRVSKMSQGRYELLIALHEIIEALLCFTTGVDPAQIDKFDEEFEKIRGPLCKTGRYNFQTSAVLPCGCMLKRSVAEQYEPGDDPHAPYNKQHQVASVCERALAFFLGVNWGDYEREVEEL